MNMQAVIEMISYIAAGKMSNDLNHSLHVQMNGWGSQEAGVIHLD